MLSGLTTDSFGDLKITEAQIEALAAAHDELSDSLMPDATVAVAEAADDDPAALGNIVGVGVGEKTTKGVPTGRPAVKILVRKKVEPVELTEATSVPPMVGGVETDVEATGEIKALQFKAKHRPAPGGVSIGNCKENAAGTLGCWVDADKAVCILSNNHVMARSNDASKGETIAQPGRLDDGVCPKDVIAELLRFVPINFTGTNEVDAAIAAAIDSKYIDSRILRGKGNLESLVPPHVEATLGMKVQKSGRTTGWTHGAVNLLAVTVNVRYPGNRIARFDNQFRVSAATGDFSQPGDSGSLVATDPRNQPVGLLFAGGGGYTFCNDIARVLTDLIVAMHY